ncbi:hypothetical protein AURDEDRAFT_168105 [Auricularia subglabra TFB-10046 SS5]|nr:hypothetical protein AURDEDRAFT_168105 [Auricularia subglabra TFB-10046 SS5]
MSVTDFIERGSGDSKVRESWVTSSSDSSTRLGNMETNGLERLSPGGKAPRKTDQPIVLPARWGSNLRHLGISKSLFQPGTVFAALRSLHGIIPESLEAPVPLVVAFPNLTDINFYSVTKESLALLSPLPPRLESIMLSPSSPHSGLDYSSVFRGRIPSNLRTLRITAPTPMTYIFYLFARIVDGPWNMRIDHHLTIQLTAPDSDVVFDLVPCSVSRQWLKQEPRLLDSWAHLRDLTLGLRVFEDIYRAIQPHTVFLSLVSVTVSNFGGVYTPDAFLDGGPLLIAAPSLEAITYRSWYDKPGRCLSLLAQIVTAFSAPKLKTIFVYADTAETMGSRDLSEIAHLSERVVINDFGGETLCVLVEGEKQESV